MLLLCTGHVRWREASLTRGARGKDIGGVASAPSDSELLWPGDIMARRE